MGVIMIQLNNVAANKKSGQSAWGRDVYRRVRFQVFLLGRSLVGASQF